MQQAKPYKVEPGVPDRKYTVKPNGDVEMVETITSTVTFAGREFITFVRNHEYDVESIEKQLGEDHKKKLEENKETLKKEIIKLKPIVADAEKNLKETYEAEQKKAFISQLKTQLNAKPIKKDLIMAMWNSAPSEEKKQEVLDELTKEEKATLLNLRNPKARATGK